MQIRFIEQKSVIPNVMIKLLFTVGSVNDPKGKEGLAELSAAMITDAGSKSMRLDEIQKALFPIAGSFNAQVDKEMTTFTAVVHKDNLQKFLDVVLPMLLTPGFREDDFSRVKDAQLNGLETDLRASNDEELGKEQLQNVIFDGTPYGHTPLGTLAGIKSITLDDVKKFVDENYNATNVVVGLSGDYPESLVKRLTADLGNLGAGGEETTIAQMPAINGHKATGLEVEIVKKDTRATAISLGHPIPVTREDPDFAALNLARVWLGEHRASLGRLYDRIRETRGLNYGDYAYVEYFNRPGFQFFPSPNIGRRSQLFEIWIRPVVPVNTQMALRIALYETQKMIDNGLSQEDFENTRNYVMKNVYLLTSTQNQRLGYALDSWWYGMPDYVDYMRGQYAKLTRQQVNAAIKKYLSVKNMNVVIITKDAAELRDLLLKDEPSSLKYDAPKPELAQEDKAIGSLQAQSQAGERPDRERGRRVREVTRTRLYSNQGRPLGRPSCYCARRSERPVQRNRHAPTIPGGRVRSHSARTGRHPRASGRVHSSEPHHSENYLREVRRDVSRRPARAVSNDHRRFSGHACSLLHHRQLDAFQEPA